MAAEKMSTLAFLIFVCALAGVSHGAEQACSTVKSQVFSKLVSCVMEKHPQYFMVILTKMENPAAMENPDFMCSKQGLMTSLSECLLEYVKGCMPSSVASQVAQIMPTHQTIQKGIEFLCKHRSDFDDQCVKSRLVTVGQCISSKMQTFSRVTRSISPQPHMQGALCFALQQEEQCLDQSLAGCPAQKITIIKDALMAFFPKDSCPGTPSLLPQVLQFQPENGRH